MLSLLVMIGGLACARARSEAAPEPIPYARVVTALPRTTLDTLKFAFHRDAGPAWAAIVASTGLLYTYDQDLDGWAKRRGRAWAITSENNIKDVIKLGPHPLFRVPTDSGSALYFLGDGWTHFSIAGGFLIAGDAGPRARARNTGLQIVHGITVAQILNQFLKHTTGRESPFVATKPRGRWRVLPNQVEYGRHTPSYDAFPSGHVMTATMVFTTIRMNYPAQSWWLWPLEIVWNAGLAFQMMNNGVHWASDYPLGLAMGWAVARVTHDFGRPAGSPRPGAWALSPSFAADRTPLLTATRSF